MPQQIGAISYLVRDYDEAIEWLAVKLGFALLSDTPLGGSKRWVEMAPKASLGTRLLLARADGLEQVAAIGRAAGGKVAFFLYTDSFVRDHAAMQAAGVKFRETPRRETYGTVAAFEDLYGNGWDLIEPSSPNPACLPV